MMKKVIDKKNMNLLNHSLGERKDTFTITDKEYQQSMIVEYQLAGVHVVPGAWYLDMILLAARQTLAVFSKLIVDTFAINQILMVNASQSFELSISIEWVTAGDRTCISFYSIDSAKRRELNREFGAAINRKEFLAEKSNLHHLGFSNPAVILEMPEIYKKMKSYGVAFSGSFQSIATLSGNQFGILAQIKPTDCQSMEYCYHPGQWHAIFQTLTFYVSLVCVNVDQVEFLYLPIGFSRIEIYNRQSIMHSSLVIAEEGVDGEYKMQLLGPDEEMLVCVFGCQMKKVSLCHLEKIILIFLSNRYIADSSKSIASRLLENIRLLRRCNNQLPKVDKVALIASIVFLWASKIIPWK